MCLAWGSIIHECNSQAGAACRHANPGLRSEYTRRCKMKTPQRWRDSISVCWYSDEATVSHRVFVLSRYDTVTCHGGVRVCVCAKQSSHPAPVRCETSQVWPACPHPNPDLVVSRGVDKLGGVMGLIASHHPLHPRPHHKDKDQDQDQDQDQDKESAVYLHSKLFDSWFFFSSSCISSRNSV